MDLKILKTNPQYRSLVNPLTEDIVLRANPHERINEGGYYEVIITGENNPDHEHETVRGNINHKRQIALYLKTGYNDLSPSAYDIDRLSETDYEGIIQDHASALHREGLI